MFLGVPTSAPWRHISCTSITPALRFPKFLSVQITAKNSIWSYLCWCCNENSFVLEIPFLDSVAHSSFPHTLSWFCRLLCFREFLTTYLTDVSYWKLSHSKYLTLSILFTHKMWLVPFLRSQSMPSPFNLLYFLPYTYLHLQPYFQVIP